jgi:catechol 2,3-dioxygenase-like lactoylglutathione lyase family enzyme
VSDVRRSLEFYRKLGFELFHVFGDGPGGKGERLEDGMHVDGRHCRGAVLTLGEHPRCWTKLELIEWVEPAPEPRTPPSPHSLGVGRIALRCKGLLELVERLNRQGVAFETPPRDVDIVGARRFALLRDPDGVLLELIDL